MCIQGHISLHKSLPLRCALCLKNPRGLCALVHLAPFKTMVGHTSWILTLFNKDNEEIKSFFLIKVILSGQLFINFSTESSPR